jgi:hypothetical protein
MKYLERFSLAADFSRVTEEDFGLFCEKLAMVKKKYFSIEPTLYRGKNIIKLQKILDDNRKTWPLF